MANTDSKLLNGILLLILFTLFSLAYIDAVISPQFGWWQYYAWRMDNGDILYKDVYLFMTPYFVFLTKLLYSVFGNHFMCYTICFGLPVKLLCLLLVYLFLCRITKPFFASISTFLGGCMSATYNTDILYDFNPVTILPFLLSAYAFLNYYESLQKGNSGHWMALLTGFFVAVTLCLKQTFGIAILFAMVIMVIFFYNKERLGTFRQHMFDVLFFCLGGILGVLPLFFYLSSNGCVHEFSYCMAAIGDAKGGLAHILARLIYAFSFVKAWAYMLIIVVLWQMMRFFLGKRQYRMEPYGSILRGLNSAMVLLLPLSVIIYAFLPFDIHHAVAQSSFVMKWHPRLYYLLAYSGIVGWLILLCRYFLGKTVDKSLLVFTSVFAAHYFAGILSTDLLEEVYLFLYIPWMLVFVLNLQCPFRWQKDIVVLFTISVFSLTCISVKKSTPYEWHGWREPAVSAENVNCTVPGLEGLSVPTDVDKTFNQFVSLINEHTTADDKVLQFANIPLFNLLTERATPGYAPITWFDVCPDEIAEGVARECFAHPPKMVVWHNMDQENWDTVEKVFRNGQRSGQREIQRFYDEVVTRDYRLLLRANNHRDGMLELWLRNTR